MTTITSQVACNVVNADSIHKMRIISTDMDIYKKMRIIFTECEYFHEMRIISTKYGYIHEKWIIPTERGYFHNNIHDQNEIASSNSQLNSAHLLVAVLCPSLYLYHDELSRYYLMEEFTETFLSYTYGRIVQVLNVQKNMIQYRIEYDTTKAL